MSVQRSLLAAFCGLCFATAVVAGSRPVAVSPGSPTGALIADACPTFNWGGVEGAKSYELVVYEVWGEGDAANAVLQHRIPGTATGWTPSLDRCLERGKRYAWSVRAVGEESSSRWSPPSLFQVAAGLGRADFEAALQVVRSYLATGEEGVELPSDGAARVRVREPPSSAASTKPAARAAPAPTQLSVDGNIAATSYTGDGGNLANVATDAELVAHADLPDAHREHATLEESSEIDADILAHKNLASDHHAATVDTFVTNKDAHDHLGGDGAAVLHSSLGSVGEGDHHVRFSDSEVIAAIAAVDRGCPGALGSGSRYTDCGNGAVRDNNTGLIWLKDATCSALGPLGSGIGTWTEAQAAAAALGDGNCGLTDGSSAGDWRLPSVLELCSAWSGSNLLPCPASAASNSLIDSSVGPPTVVNAAGDGVWAEGDAFSGVTQWQWVWSGEESTGLSAWAAIYDLAEQNGWILTLTQDSVGGIWPVRGGQ